MEGGSDDGHTEIETLRSTKSSGSSQHCLSVAREEQATNGAGIGVDRSSDQAEDCGMEVLVGTTIMASEQDSIMPLNQTESDHSYTTAEQASDEVDRARVQVIAIEPTSIGGGTDQEDVRQENLDGKEAKIIVFRSSDVDQNVNPAGSTLNGTLLAELTKESPPSYESVVKASVIISTEKPSTCDDGTNVITTQPRTLSSSTISQPAVDYHNANLDVASQSVPDQEVDSVTAQLNSYSGYEYTPDSRTCCTSTQCTSCQCLSDCCDACADCCNSEEMKCFCEVS